MNTKHTVGTWGRMASCAVVAVAVLLAAGCALEEKKDPGRIAQIKPGDPTSRLLDVLGQPLYINMGEYERTGHDVWVYPTGYIQTYRESAERVVPIRDPKLLPPRRRRADVIGETAELDPFKRDARHYDYARENNEAEMNKGILGFGQRDDGGARFND